ncbi:hypothetical protein [Streptomyces sp. NPDC046887]|uniref:hypothetical protein n=1 Tax=Streptomyces sp. NPDC046887 TaxID=3155472 RepID=UPI0033DE680C
MLLLGGAAWPYAVDAASHVLAALLIATLVVHTPGALGRTSSAFRTLTVGGTPLGALLGGAAAGWAPNAPALLAAVLFGLATASLVGQIN